MLSASKAAKNHKTRESRGRPWKREKSLIGEP